MGYFLTELVPVKIPLCLNYFHSSSPVIHELTICIIIHSIFANPGDILSFVEEGNLTSLATLVFCLTAITKFELFDNAILRVRYACPERQAQLQDNMPEGAF